METKKDNFDYIEFAREFISSYFSDLSNEDKLNANGYMEFFDIQHDNKVLLEHCIAIRNLLNKAIEELESKNEEKK